MADTCARTGQLEEAQLLEPPSWSGASSDLESVPALGNEIEHAATASPPFLPARAETTGTTETVRKRMERDGNSLSVEEQIEHSKSHWSQVMKPGSRKPGSRKPGSRKLGSFSRILAALIWWKWVQPSGEVFKALQSHLTWGCFFHTFGYDFGIWKSMGSLVVEEKFVEGEFAKFFNAPYHVEKQTVEKGVFRK